MKANLEPSPHNTLRRWAESRVSFAGGFELAVWFFTHVSFFLVLLHFGVQLLFGT